jgi:hypothetical protein
MEQLIFYTLVALTTFTIVDLIALVTTSHMDSDHVGKHRATNNDD